MTREEAARVFAEAMGWRFASMFDNIEKRHHVAGIFYGSSSDEKCDCWECDSSLCLPAPDAPMFLHLAFVGSVAEALGAGVQMGYDPKVRAAWVGFDERLRFADASDPSWACMLAATAAKGARG